MPASSAARADESLAGHQIAATLKAGSFTAYGVTADTVETAFTYAGNALSFERLTAGNVAGAALTAIGRVESGDAGLSGSGRMTVKAEDPAEFFKLVRDKLPGHPALDQLVKNAGWYANTELKATLALGGKQGKGFSLKATRHQQRLHRQSRSLGRGHGRRRRFRRHRLCRDARKHRR